jgi:hypothetical protein
MPTAIKFSLCLGGLFLFTIFCQPITAKENFEDVLNSYYQSLIDNHTFYYEIDINTKDDYGKKVVDDSFTLDSMAEESEDINKLNTKDNLEGSTLKDSQSTSVALYKEIKENFYEVATKVLSDSSTELSLFKTAGRIQFYTPLIVNGLDVNLLDYISIYHEAYNFEVIKTTESDYFYRGILKPELLQQNSNLFKEVQIKFSKEYNIPTKITLYDKKNKIEISIEVADTLKNRNNYIPSKFIVYNNGEKTTISLHNIQVGIPIDIENNYKITLQEYIDLNNDENN